MIQSRPGPPVQRAQRTRRAIETIAIAFIILWPAAPGLRAQPVAASGNTFNVKQYGATGSRDGNATKAIQAAIDACTAAGGGIVYVPPGEYTTGAIHLKDNVNLHLEAGATLFLSQNAADFTGRPRSMINSSGAKNIAVTGRGTSTAWRNTSSWMCAAQIPRSPGRRSSRAWPAFPSSATIAPACRPICSSSTTRQMCAWKTSRSSTRRSGMCGSTTATGSLSVACIFTPTSRRESTPTASISSPRATCLSPIPSSSPRTTPSSLRRRRRGDRAAKPVENVTVTNCILTSSSTPMMIGTETHADVRHVVFSNSVIRDSNKAFGINVQDGATVSDVLFTNITMDSRRRHWNWWGSAETFKFVLKKRTPTSRLGAIRDIVIDNVVSRARGTSTITGHAERRLENITISNLQMFMEAENTPDKRTTDAIRADGVSGLKIRNVSVRWAEDATEEKWRSAMVLQNINDLEVDNFSGRQGLKTGKAPAVVLENVVDGVLRNLRALEGSGAFLEFRGAQTRTFGCTAANCGKRPRP